MIYILAALMAVMAALSVGVALGWLWLADAIHEGRL